jgi:hypothetical protein
VHGQAAMQVTAVRIVASLVVVAAARGLLAQQPAVPAGVPSYAGSDARGVPHYFTKQLSSEERRLLRTAYGIEEPARLYLSDSTADRLLKYDTRVKSCARCYVNSYRVGFVSIRRRRESWDQLERRVLRMPRSRFSPADRQVLRSTALLDPAIRRDVEAMLVAARRAGFKIRVKSTYRTPSAEAYLMARGGGRTHTLTSLHSYGRAIDVVVGDGVLRHSTTRRRWVAFRRWVTQYRGDEFRIIGRPDRSWDWPHVEIPSAQVGFRTVDEALARARRCQAAPKQLPCDFAPNLPR